MGIFCVASTSKSSLLSVERKLKVSSSCFGDLLPLYFWLALFCCPSIYILHHSNYSIHELHLLLVFSCKHKTYIFITLMKSKYNLWKQIIYSNDVKHNIQIYAKRDKFYNSLIQNVPIYKFGNSCNQMGPNVFYCNFSYAP